MMTVFLERTPKNGFTAGVLLFPNGEEIKTLEREWKDNVPFDSCIPDGVYKCTPYKSPRFGNVYIVEGGTVSKFKSSKHARYGILFHPANQASQLAGCIAPVTTLSEGGWGAESASAMNKFRGLTAGEPFMLFISGLQKGA